MIAKAKHLLGIYGGSFDPIHLGHLIVAQDCVEQLGLEAVIFMPAAQSPLKSHRPQTFDAHRLEMVKRATAQHPQFRVSDHEITRGGVSYTVDTVNHLQQAHSEAEFYLIIGQDQTNQLHAWHAIETLIEQVAFIAVSRPGYEPEAPRIPGIRFTTVNSHTMDISSSEIRERFSHGLSNDLFLHPEVSSYIAHHQLYSTQS